MIAAKTIVPTSKVRRMDPAKERFRGRGASALLSIGKRANGIATNLGGQLQTGAIKLPIGVFTEDACVL
jgi:hypothetical protein